MVSSKNYKWLVSLMILNFVKIGSLHYVDDYSWRDYKNYIPRDAFVAGEDIHGNRLYFGQTLHDSKLIPGKIVQNQRGMIFEYFSKEYNTDDNVKILCAQNPNVFKWVPTSANGILGLKNKTLIKGGFEPNVSTYLGRTFENGINSIGKIICMVQECYGLYVTNDGATQLVKENIEILTHGDISNTLEIHQGGCQPITINIFKSR